jgi:hypothetical protein
MLEEIQCLSKLYDSALMAEDTINQLEQPLWKKYYKRKNLGKPLLKFD